VKSLGDHSRDMPQLRPGTRVLPEGPYGAFTARRRRLRKVLLIAGGVGITPLRALFESLPGPGSDITLLYRVSRPEDILFGRELDEIARTRGSRVGYLVGSRAEHPEFLTAPHLRALIPDISRHDVFVCGPSSLIETVNGALAQLGVPARQIHRESFEL
jgi:ferredoxin-NADP reductase